MSEVDNRSSDDLFYKLRNRATAFEITRLQAHALLDCAEALRPFANYACNPPCDCHNCRARKALNKLEQS